MTASPQSSVQVCSPNLDRGDDLSRDVYGLLGMPIDALDRTSALKRIVAAAAQGHPFLLSTPNVNFLTASNGDAEFRESLLSSDLCCVDGMPIVWLARLLGIPIKHRVSGSDLFGTLRSTCSSFEPIKVFLFGGDDGVAQMLCQLINAEPEGMRCVGWLSPGFGTVAEMSAPSILQTINDSAADFLAVFLSAKKAQSWLVLNHDRLRVPVRGQFGGTINYQAGTVRRAPGIFQRFGFEWLWRIKEEPYLWRRYWKDGLVLSHVVVTRALPIAIDIAWRRYVHKDRNEELSFWTHKREGLVVIGLVGFATKTLVPKSIAFFRMALAESNDIVLDVSQTRAIDPRFFGLLLMLRKQLKDRGKVLRFTGVSKRAKRIFRLNGFEFLLKPEHDLSGADPALELSN